MALSVRERILVELVKRLETIKTPDYDITLKKISRNPLNPLNEEEMPLLVLMDVAEDVDEGSPVQHSTKILHIEMQYWIQAYEDMSQELNKALAAIQKAMQVDPHFNNLVHDTDEISNTFITTEEISPFGGFAINYDLGYRHRLADPYST